MSHHELSIFWKQSTANQYPHCARVLYKRQPFLFFPPPDMASTGHYVYIEGTGVHAWNAAHLISPSLAPLPRYCATFFFHMFGEDTGELSLRVLDDSQPEQLSEELWTMLWEQGDQWFNASVDVECARGCKVGNGIGWVLQWPLHLCSYHGNFEIINQQF